MIDLPPIDVWVLIQHVSILLGIVATALQIRSLTAKLNGHLRDHMDNRSRDR